jgi:L-threonylcarbamoyladenylate synthase
VTVDDAVAALVRGEPVVLPTDTVYGLCSLPEEVAVLRLYGVKGRRADQPTSLIARDLDTVRELLPELSAREQAIAEALVPGPYTLVVANPARRLPWLAAGSPETLGIRVPAARGALRQVLEHVGALAATSANLPGGPDPRRLEQVPVEIREVCLALDEGELGSAASTVIDVTGEPRVLREGIAPGAEALARIAAVSRSG